MNPDELSFDLESLRDTYGSDFMDNITRYARQYAVDARTITEGASPESALPRQRERDPFDNHKFNEDEYNEDQLKRLGVK
jgi:hypothetical protein